jgi:hypothetical protein
MARQPISIKATNLNKVLAAIQAKSLKGRKQATAEVGFNAPHAIFVHENLQAAHKVGQAKFLTTAARQQAPAMRQVIRQELARKQGVETAVMRAARMLLAASTALVPVDTGFLRASGFARVV